MTPQPCHNKPTGLRGANTVNRQQLSVRGLQVFAVINGIIAVGFASLLTITEHGQNIHNRYGAVIIELSVPLLAIFWQWRVARNALPESK